MTQNKVQKAAIRRRMAETGESYVVARRIVLGEANRAGSELGAQGAQGTAGGQGVWGAAEAAEAAGLTPEEQYALEARAAGASAEAIDTQTLVYRLEAAADRAQEAAELARIRADEAEQDAEEAEERAGLAEEAAEEAEEWAERPKSGCSETVPRSFRKPPSGPGSGPNRRRRWQSRLRSGLNWPPTRRTRPRTQGPLAGGR